MSTASGEGVLELRCLEVFGGAGAERRELSVAGLDVLVHAAPFENAEVGGDLHYISTCMRGAVSRFMVADVAGHGEHVAGLALSLRRIMRKHINTPDQTKLTRQLNEEFSQLGASGKFATAVLGTYYGPARSLILSNAGHPPPLWYSSDANQWRLLTADAGVRSGDMPGELANLPLGIIEPTAYEQFAVEIGVGDAVVFYTDSLIEAMDEQGRQLGPEGLLKIAEQAESDSLSTFCDSLLARVATFRQATQADDDLTVVILRQNAGEPPSKSIGDWVDTLGRLITGR